MRVAALDLGTNTFLCLVADVQYGRLQKIVADFTWLVRLGENMHSEKKFSSGSLERARAALSEAIEKIASLNVERRLAVATSAARDASNGHELIEMCQGFDLPVEIISGEREAQLTFAGATSLQPQSYRQLVIDVGGGSTEFALKGDEQAKLLSASLDVGSVRLTEMYFAQSPPSAADILLAQEKVAGLLKQGIHWPRNLAESILAVGGTPTTLVAASLGKPFSADEVEGARLTAEQLDFWIREFGRLSADEISEKCKIEKRRADVILAGVVILRESLRSFCQSEMMVTTRGVRFGVALELGAQIQ